MWKNTLDNICETQTLTELVQQYIDQCRSETLGAKKHERFPNIAGFCRFCGLNGDDLLRLKREHPDSYSAMCLIFEDEALNSDVSASVLSAYLKKRLGYGEDEENTPSCQVGDQLKLVFDHDILSDGE